jgi:hypothetical protein
VSVILTALAVAAGAATAKAVSVFIDRRRASKTTAAQAQGAPPERTSAETDVTTDEPKKEDVALLRAFPCKLGDVVTSPMHGEAWLAGCLLLSEGTAVRAVFVAPEAGADRYIVAKPEPEPSLFLALSVPDLAKLLAHEPPMSLEHESSHYLRKRRLPLRCARLGAGAPAMGETLIYAEYEAAGDAGALFILMGTEQTLVLHGSRLAPGMFDVYPGTPASE